MNVEERKIEIKGRVETAFWQGVDEGGGKGQAFEELIDYVVELEERIEKLERRAR